MIAAQPSESGPRGRFHAVRAHLLEQAGDTEAAIAEFRLASDRSTNLRELPYLTTEAARVKIENTLLEQTKM